MIRLEGDVLAPGGGKIHVVVEDPVGVNATAAAQAVRSMQRAATDLLKGLTNKDDE